VVRRRSQGLIPCCGSPRPDLDDTAFAIPVESRDLAMAAICLGSCPDSVGAKVFSSFFKLGKARKKRRKRET